MPLSPPTGGSASATGSKRRATEALDQQRRRPYPTPAATGDREDKRHVSFGRRLVRGPSPAYSRNRTPSRAAPPRLPVEPVQIVDSSDEIVSPQLSPSEQLRLEEIYATTEYAQEGDGTPLTTEYQQLHPLSTEQRLLKDLTNETERDNEVCRRVHELRARTVDFARGFVANTEGPLNGKRCLNEICWDIHNAQLVRYIGCLAQGGPDFEESWRELLVDDDCRAAVVVGIIGTALKEHVFSESWFGGTDEQIEELEKLQERQKHGDGYERTKHRAKSCNRYKDATEDLPAARNVAAALLKMLTRLYCMDQKYVHYIPDDLSKDLYTIVTLAGNLSREMRRCGDVIYHWPPTFKDEEFDPERMECINIATMISESPYEKKVIDGHERSVLKGSQENAEAIVKVVAFPGLVVHRQGGGALAKRLLEEEEVRDNQHTRAPPDVMRARRMAMAGDDKLTGDEGYRTRVICKSVVHLIWGRQRLLTREAGTAAHLDAMRDGQEKKYEDDRKGFIELYDYFLATNLDASRSLS